MYDCRPSFPHNVFQHITAKMLGRNLPTENKAEQTRTTPGNTYFKQMKETIHRQVQRNTF